MRSIYYHWFILLAFAASSSAEPYSAVITTDGVAVRSGPGIEFYPVLQLQTGDKVDIYHVQNDWCAIRPPIGSFSWVSAKYIDVDSGNLGTVLADGLASRIGSQDSEDCETVQVTLKKGETVLILDRKETPENAVSPVWYKIAPPGGEFRWIHKSALTPAIQQVRYDDVDSSAVEMEVSELPKLTLPEPSALESAPKVTSLVDPFHKAFNELQRESYVAMTRPTNDEVFAILIHRAEELHQIAETDHDLEKTYHLLESLQRTRSIRQEMALRRSATASANRNFAPITSPPPPFNSGAPAPQRQSIVPAYTPTAAQNIALPQRAGVNIGGFDIVGRLGEFDPLPKGHPPYAVVDEKEQVICLISPSGKMDLSQYVGQFVGINGVLGYYERQPGKLPSRHITVRTIRPLR